MLMTQLVLQVGQVLSAEKGKFRVAERRLNLFVAVFHSLRRNAAFG